MRHEERETKHTGGKRRLAVAVATAFAVLTLAGTPAGAATSDTAAEGSFVAATNSLRSTQGLPSLQVHPNLVAKARQWAAHMAAAGSISHSNLPDGVTVQWQRLGENVGMGPSVQAIQDALVASPSHYENLTDPGFRFVGVGVVSANGTMYVSEVFMQVASQPAPNTSTSTTGTPSSPEAPGSAPAPAPAVEPPAPAPVAAPAAPAPPVALRESLPAPPPRLAEMLAHLRSLEAA